jgi:hypothetical protein
MNKFLLSEEEKNEILRQHISMGYKSSVNEQIENYRYKKAIQCFLNKKGVMDNSNQPLKIDGSIGKLPNSKSAQAIAKYQKMLRIPEDGVWGQNTMDKMPDPDKKIFKECIAEHGDLLDKGRHWLGMD